MKELWKQRIIIQLDPQHRPYLIKGEYSGVYRRNIYVIRPDENEH